MNPSRFSGQGYISKRYSNDYLHSQFIMKPTAYVKNRWRIFVANTTIHGVKEVALAPTCSLRTLWLLLLLSFSGCMSYQIFHLTNHFLQEPVVVVIKSMSDADADNNANSNSTTKYELPLTLLLTPTLDLFNASPEANRALNESPFDMHTRYYIRSLVDSNFQVPDDYNGTRGREEFDRYLANHSHLTWHDVISPFVANVSYWLGEGDDFKSFSIVTRTVSAYMTYHFIKPIFDQSTLRTADETKDILLDAAIDFSPNVMKKSTSDHGRTPLFCFTSYGLAADMVRLKSGTTYKISFDIIGHRRISLKRRPCVDKVQYQSFDYEACSEQCRFDAEHKWIPQTCYRHTFDWGFYRTFIVARPCSHGVHYNASTVDEGGVLDEVESPAYLREPSLDDLQKVNESYESCLSKHCVHACQQMSVKFYTKSSDFHERLGNKSMIWVTWPGPGAVPVYAETLQYTWDGYVGQLGGLMGLWMGASMISMWELVYVCCCCCFRVRRPGAFTTKEKSNRRRTMRTPAYSMENGELTNGLYKVGPETVDLVECVNENSKTPVVTLC